MDAVRLVQKMAAFPEVLTAVVAGIDDDSARWRPREGAWSILEIAGHLHLEEIQDFRPRLASTLEDPDRRWPPLDPEGAVREFREQAAKLQETVEGFGARRIESIDWLESILSEADWERAYRHPSLGALRAGDLLAAWAAHDDLHLRQIVERRFQLVEHHSGVYKTKYAGVWPDRG